jgi:aerobic-type carbon monoxide dehydrogenase small subunit (CoxS/CutS family)
MAFMLRSNETNRSLDGDTPLLRMLRDMLGKTGTKFGCGSRTGSSGTTAINEHRRFDSLTIAVRGRQAPEAWDNLLTEKKIGHSPNHHPSGDG